eukprot:Platyproteum_vivax@DN7529_c0_g1_i3.p2
MMVYNRTSLNKKAKEDVGRRRSNRKQKMRKMERTAELMLMIWWSNLVPYQILEHTDQTSQVWEEERATGLPQSDSIKTDRVSAKPDQPHSSEALPVSSEDLELFQSSAEFGHPSSYEVKELTHADAFTKETVVEETSSRVDVLYTVETHEEIISNLHMYTEARLDLAPGAIAGLAEKQDETNDLLPPLEAPQAEEEQETAFDGDAAEAGDADKTKKKRRRRRKKPIGFAETSSLEAPSLGVQSLEASSLEGLLSDLDHGAEATTELAGEVSVVSGAVDWLAADGDLLQRPSEDGTTSKIEESGDLELDKEFTTEVTEITHEEVDHKKKKHRRRKKKQDHTVGATPSALDTGAVADEHEMDFEAQGDRLQQADKVEGGSTVIVETAVEDPATASGKAYGLPTEFEANFVSEAVEEKIVDHLIESDERVEEGDASGYAGVDSGVHPATPIEVEADALESKVPVTSETEFTVEGELAEEAIGEEFSGEAKMEIESTEHKKKKSSRRRRRHQEHPPATEEARIDTMVSDDFSKEFEQPDETQSHPSWEAPSKSSAAEVPADEEWQIEDKMNEALTAESQVEENEAFTETEKDSYGEEVEGERTEEGMLLASVESRENKMTVSEVCSSSVGEGQLFAAVPGVAGEDSAKIGLDAADSNQLGKQRGGDGVLGYEETPDGLQE